MLRTHSQIARDERYRNSRSFIAKKYSNGYEEMICSPSPLILSFGDGNGFIEEEEEKEEEATMAAATAQQQQQQDPWDSIISVSPLARNALCSEPIGTKKVGLRRIRNPPIGTKKVGLLGYLEAQRKKRSFGKDYYTAASEEETYSGITKSWNEWKNYGSAYCWGPDDGEPHLLWTIVRAWSSFPQDYRSRIVGLPMVGLPAYNIVEFLDQSIDLLKVFLRFINYNFHWTTGDGYFNEKHDRLHASMLAFCQEVDEHYEMLLGCALAEQMDQIGSGRQRRGFFKNLKIILAEVSLFRQKYAKYAGVRTLVLSDILKVDENVSSSILSYLY